jgi:hypothetical protein
LRVILSGFCQVFSETLSLVYFARQQTCWVGGLFWVFLHFHCHFSNHSCHRAPKKHVANHTPWADDP